PDNGICRTTTHYGWTINLQVEPSIAIIAPRSGCNVDDIAVLEYQLGWPVLRLAVERQRELSTREASVAGLAFVSKAQTQRTELDRGTTGFPCDRLRQRKSALVQRARGTDAVHKMSWSPS